MVITREVAPLIFSLLLPTAQLHHVTSTDTELVTTFVEDKGEGLQIFSQNFTDASLSVDEVSTSANLQFINPIQDVLIVKSQY